MNNLIETLTHAGVSEKEAHIYLAALELGEATVQQLAAHAQLKRTTMYPLIDALVKIGILQQTKRKKKTWYLAASPKYLVQRARESTAQLEHAQEILEQRQRIISPKPRVSFLYGSAGFKQIWDKILSSSTKEYRIITTAEQFLDFVPERYILDEIIGKKKQLNIHTKQLISDSPYARKIIAKDIRENRESKILPAIYKLPFSTLITDTFVAFISPKFENMFFVVENESFAKTHRSIFEILWNKFS
ncbi:MAG: helix-turn-helix domain-containing protein [bacterium]|nr:helix-turn-helix domain-containing protein [bacterium]